jgi:hypothetical protein
VAARDDYMPSTAQAAYQAAISRGQHEFPGGLFFGGTAPTWSNQTLRRVLRQHGSRASRMAWIDIHTGLGPSGVGERIYAGATTMPPWRARAVVGRRRRHAGHFHLRRHRPVRPS